MSAQALYITTGEPAGIGPEICLALTALETSRPLVLLGDPDLLEQRSALLGDRAPELIPYAGQQAAAPKGSLYVQAVPLRYPVTPGVLDARNAGYVIDQLSLASELCLNHQAAGIVTAPVQKSVINEAGIPFSGHTEFFQEKAGCDRVVMMLATEQLRVALATTHLPLRAVPDAINRSVLQEVLAIILTELRTKFGIAQPRLLVCGLNPHAGENGYLGTEERDLINPLLAEFRQQGWQVSDCLPADTLFTPRVLAGGDAVLAMYHDQGLPVLKSQGFGEAVNITLGLPYVRTSVDHGTALTLAGTGQASSSSLMAATRLALQLTAH